MLAPALAAAWDGCKRVRTGCIPRDRTSQAGICIPGLRCARPAARFFRSKSGRSHPHRSRIGRSFMRPKHLEKNAYVRALDRAKVPRLMGFKYVGELFQMVKRDP